jgi:phosphatidylglycerophosphate synthase
MFELKYLTDRYLLLPIVEKTDFLYTKYKITPNAITIFNSLYISNMVLYNWMVSNYFLSSIFLFIRLLLDGVDGYIARKYNLLTKEGEMYDHGGDSIFIGYTCMTMLYKLHFTGATMFIAGNTAMVTCMIINFNVGLQYLAIKIFGAGGNYDSYCSLMAFMTQAFIMLIDYW